MQVQLVEAKASPKTDRVGRYPKHTFNVKASPFTICPIGIAPVLPGETFKSMFMESRVVTDPIKNPLIGWKKDYFFFYCKATTLMGDAIRQMFVDLRDGAPTDLQTTHGIANHDQQFYTAMGGVPYLRMAVESIVNNFFRDEGELHNTYPYVGGYPVAQIRENSWMDSLSWTGEVPLAPEIDGASDTTDLQRLLNAFEQLKALGIANMTYEEYLATFGIKVDEDKVDRPELLFHCSDFQYPSNTVNPADGTVASAVSWVFRQGETKKRKFFREPGFVVGVTTTRPKVYFTGLSGNMAAHMSRAWDWMPELLESDERLGGLTSLKKFSGHQYGNNGLGPIGDRGGVGATSADVGEYFVDMQDLLLQGDQFQNRVAFGPDAFLDPALDRSAVNGINLPDTALNWRYPYAEHITALFKTAAAGVREDGYFSLNIQGKQRENLPGRLTLANLKQA